MRFRIWNIVRIAKNSDIMVGDHEYPRNRNGKVVGLTDDQYFPINVIFDDVDYTLESSSFRESELRLVRRG